MKVAVVIPAYNAERTIERTVRSVLASSIPLDVWVVDDGSTDRTGEILDRLVRNQVNGEGEQWNGQLSVVHQENCGAYQARLNALKRITTPYFGFVDADDTVEPTMFEKMVEFAEKQQLDVVRCSYDGIPDLGNDFSDRTVLASREQVFTGYVRSELIDGTTGGAFIWNKLYRNQYDFSLFDPTDRDTNFDDLIFNLQFFLKVERMGFLASPLYHYATTVGSAAHSFGENKLKDFREVVRVRRALLPHYGIDPDGAENRAWFKLNRMNCIKATVRAGNLSLGQKVGLIVKLLKGRAV